MKKIAIALFSILTCLSVFAGNDFRSFPDEDLQGGQVKIVLKSGSSITGNLVGIDGASSITISVAGIETVISMEEILSVEPIASAQSGPEEIEMDSDDFTKALPSDKYGEYVILDKAEYPESFTLSAGGQNFTMVLIRGGVYNMGYDDRHSLAFRSEPVHKVKLSSFYVSKEMVEEQTAYSLLGKTGKTKDGVDFNTVKWEEARQIVDLIAEQEGMPYRLITEAEWEYMAITPYAEMVFPHPMVEWCNDFYGEYEGRSQIDPQGPSSGKWHVARMYSTDISNRDRTVTPYTSHNQSFMRIVISASDVVFDNERFTGLH